MLTITCTLIAAVLISVKQECDAATGIQLGELQGDYDISGIVRLTSPTTIVIDGFSFNANPPVIDGFSFNADPPDTLLYFFGPGVPVDPRGNGGTILPVQGDFATSEGGFMRFVPISNIELTVDLQTVGVDACGIGTLTLWCREAGVFFTQLSVPRTSFEQNGEDPCTLRNGSSGHVTVGTLPPGSHEIGGLVEFTSPTTIFIGDFTFDGMAPDTFLYFYSPGQAVDGSASGTTIPLSDELSITNAEGGFVGFEEVEEMDLSIGLPQGTTVCDIGTLTLWCRTAGVVFSQLPISRSLFISDGNSDCRLNLTVNDGSITVPTKSKPEKEDFDNCIPLHESLQVYWMVNRNDSIINFKLCGCQGLDPEIPQYMGFGVSGSDNSVSMDGADPIIAWIDNARGAQAVDYHLSGRFQCRSGQGVCPDEVDVRGICTNDVFNVTGEVLNRKQCVSFSRSFASGDDTCDLPIDPDNRQFIIWAVGGLGVTAFKHFTRAEINELPIHFGREPSNQCSNVKLVCRSCDVFEAQQMIAREDTTFNVHIGPSGNERGYMGITGRPGWGIAWYVDGILIPELVVERNRTYTFIVEGGRDSTDLGNYHPFYITNSIQGGRIRNSQEERDNEVVYAGFDANDNPMGVGRLCELKETIEARDTRERCGNFKEYLDQLSSPECTEGEPAVITWTPDYSTPDLVYYQCASHLNLGYRIVVADPLSRASPLQSGSTILVLLTLVLTYLTIIII